VSQHELSQSKLESQESKLKISVVVPSYNSMPYVAEAIESVLSQLRRDDEIIVQDGGSTDGTLEAMTTIAARDPRVFVKSERDSGQSQALNRALARATGDYILWLNADDIVVNGALDEARAVALSAPNAPTASPDLIVGGHQTLDYKGGVIADYVGRYLEHSRLMSRGCYVFSGSILYARDFLNSAGGFNDDLNFSMDLDLMFRLVKRNPTQEVITRPIGALRWHDASKSGSVGYKFATESWKVRRTNKVSSFDLGRSVGAFARQTIALSTISLRHSPLYKRLRGATR